MAAAAAAEEAEAAALEGGGRCCLPVHIFKIQNRHSVKRWTVQNGLGASSSNTKVIEKM
jgi:hypothetical protein